ncbi:zinc finger protein 2 homolog isoform X2 [Eurytemora carolleeae]|uniref:zinc finger protein 2 homolog isoform X2 n=1 Tax=Eurytemora carolleeae TaxID=1294199 RepID=UPI000C78BD1E|nr:zinc finger protein 2 homolog isoform X2 [Eurytemora carolleeae]|eukprot:XP_023333166.1 zinc finger protein 2 homolog isoform X2 [Eurytemora affinis]
MDKIFLQHCQSLLSDFRKIYRDPGITDLRIVCAGGEQVYSNSLLLASCSALIQGSLLRTDSTLLTEPNLEYCILIPDVSAEHLEIFLENLLQWEKVPRQSEIQVLARIGQTLGVKANLVGFEKPIPLVLDYSSATVGFEKPIPLVLDYSSATLKEDESRNEKLEFILPKRKKTPHQRTIYQCDKCQKQFGLKRNFMHHINSHLGIKPYACTQCDKRFVQRCHMNTHMKILHSGLKPYICHKCGKSFAVSSNLKKHAATHGREEEEEEGERVNDPKWKDVIEFNNSVIELSSLNGANSDPPAEKPDSDPQSRVYISASEKSQLESTNFEISQIDCSESGGGEVFSASDQLLMLDSFQETYSEGFSGDSKAENSDPVYPFTICNKTFASKSKLELHTVSHTVNKLFTCTHCGKKFKQKSHLNHHIKLKHSDGAFDSKYKCDICGKCLTSNYSLKKHKMLHWDNKPFVCLVCGKRFVQNSHLTLHVQKHSGIRSHLCIECGKSFTTKGHLKEHMKFHTGERKVYECMECKAQYFGLHDLKVHMRKHSGEMPFSCSHCPKRFRSMRNLENHSRIHTGEKPFKCRTCGRRFTTSSGLCQHFKKSSGCRRNLEDTTGSYTANLEEFSDTQIRTCIILESVDLNGKTVSGFDSLNPVPGSIIYALNQESLSDSESRFQIQNTELKIDILPSSSSPSSKPLDPSISGAGEPGSSLPSIFLESQPSDDQY